VFKTPDTSFSDERNYEQPFIECYIDEITSPGKYVIVGTVVFVGDTQIVLNDGTGEAVISLPTAFDLASIKEGAQIRVFGYMQTVPEKAVNAIIIHNISEVDIELYQRVRELERTVFSGKKSQ